MSRKKKKGRSMRQAIRGGIVRLAVRRPTVEAHKPQREGIIGPSDVRVPNGLRGSDAEGRQFPLSGLILTIVIVSLAWIGIVAWLVSRMP